VAVRAAARNDMLFWVNEHDFDEQYDQHGDSGLNTVYWIAERVLAELSAPTIIANVQRMEIFLLRWRRSAI
jgi:hypothetical protein